MFDRGFYCESRAARRYGLQQKTVHLAAIDQIHEHFAIVASSGDDRYESWRTLAQVLRQLLDFVTDHRSVDDGDAYWSEWSRSHGPLDGTWRMAGTLRLEISIRTVDGELQLEAPSGTNSRIDAKDVSFDGERLTFTLSLPGYGWSSTSELTLRSSHLMIGRSEECDEVWVRRLPAEVGG